MSYLGPEGSQPCGYSPTQQLHFPSLLGARTRGPEIPFLVTGGGGWLLSLQVASGTQWVVLFIID